MIYNCIQIEVEGDEMRKIKCAVVVFLSLAVTMGAACALVEKPIVRRLAAPEPAKRPLVLEQRTIQADELKLTYMEAGSGPWVVLIHGGIVPMSMWRSFWYNPVLALVSLGIVSPQSVLHTGAISTADTWNYNIEALAKQYHVVALDLPGFGGSDKPDTRYTREFFIAYLEAFIEAKGIDKTSLVGHGLGGEIAIGYALAHPEKVERLILVDSFGAHTGLTPFKLPRPAFSWWQREKAARINVVLGLLDQALGKRKQPAKSIVGKALCQQIAKSPPEENNNLILHRDGKSGEFIEQVAAFKADFLNTQGSAEEVRALHSALRETRRGDLMTQFNQVKVPVLIIYGRYDPVIDPEYPEFMRQEFPHSELLVYSESAHFPMVEECDRFNRDVAHFLSDPPPPAPPAAVPAGP